MRDRAACPHKSIGYWSSPRQKKAALGDGVYCLGCGVKWQRKVYYIGHHRHSLLERIEDRRAGHPQTASSVRALKSCPRCGHLWALHPPCATRGCGRDACHGHDGSDGPCDCREAAFD